MNWESVQEAFRKTFGQEPEVIARAPGRVNLIGEHTDYNEGYVFPMAIERYVYCAMAAAPDSWIELASVQQPQRFRLPVDEINQQNDWCDYVLGVYAELRSQQRLAGFRALIWGEVPLGSGLSSSAALEVAAVTALNALFDLRLPPRARIAAAHAAETSFVGVPCGVMDQFAAVAARKGHALFLDCRSLQTELHRLALQHHVILIIDSRKPRQLVDSAYRERRQQCEQAVHWLRAHYPGIRSLRDVSLRDLRNVQDRMPVLLWKRAYHVVTENDRVLASRDALRWNDLSALGSLLLSSHLSLKEYYEVSCAELDFLVDMVMMQEGALGARLTGAGFGGCTVNLVRRDRAQSIFEKVAQKYRERFGLEPRMLVSRPAAGARVVWQRSRRSKSAESTGKAAGITRSG